ncbi:MAG: hypothetical protein ACREUT_03315, partial [Steroidobacteraceae bacterium]
MTRARAALAAAFICMPVIAFAQTAPSYQLIDLGYVTGNAALKWQQSPPPPQVGGCPSLGGTGPSYFSEKRFDDSLTVGWSSTPHGTVHAVVCSKGGPAVDLGVLDGGPNSFAYSIADFNEYIVGTSQTTLTPP